MELTTLVYFYYPEANQLYKIKISYRIENNNVQYNND